MKTLLVIMGASGTGKDTLGDMLQTKDNINKLISTTTRPKRLNEVDGVDYHFVSKKKMESLTMLEQVEYADNYYGFSKETVDKTFNTSNKAFTIATLSGFVVLSKYFSGDANIRVIPVYLTAQEDTVKQRMILRGDSLESVNKRLTTDSERVKKEIKELLSMNIKHKPVIISVDHLSPKELYQKVIQLYWYKSQVLLN